MKLRNQTCLLTGASGGIGQAMAKALSREGVSLILVGRNQVRLEQLKDSLPGNHQIVQADVNTQEGRDYVLAVCKESGKVSMLINNAGVSGFAEFERHTDEAIEHIISVNLVSTMLLTKALMPILKAQKCASLVNVGSAFGSLGYPYFASYCASKFGLKGFTEALKRETAHSQINVMYFSPRATQTQINSDAVVAMNQTMGNQMDDPARVAEALIRQMKSGAARFSVGAEETFFAKVNAIFPSLVDHALSKKLSVIRQFVTQPSRVLEGN